MILMDNPQNIQPTPPMEIPENSPTITPIQYRTSRTLPLILIFTFFLLVLIVPLPYYQSEQVYCKPDQMNCPRVGWHWNKPLYQSFRKFLQYPSRSQLTLNDIQQLPNTLSPTPEVKREPTGSTANWKTYIDKENGVEFRYPQPWDAQQLTGWKLNVFLDDHPFAIPTATEFLSPIQISFNEVQNTATNQKYFQEKTLEEGVNRFKTLFNPTSLTITSLTIDDKNAFKLSGITAPGMLEGRYEITTIVQLDNKLLLVSLNDQKFQKTYNQILSTIRFLDSLKNNLVDFSLCDVGKKYNQDRPLGSDSLEIKKNTLEFCEIQFTNETEGGWATYSCNVPKLTSSITFPDTSSIQQYCKEVKSGNVFF